MLHSKRLHGRMSRRIWFRNNSDNKFIDIAVGDDILCGINFYGEVHWF